MVKINKPLLNVILLGLSFMCIFVSFQTLSNAQRFFLKRMSEDDPKFRGKGYINLSVVFGSFSVLHFIAPFIVAKPRLCMFIGSCCQLFYQIQFLYPIDWLMYTGSVICGFGGCLLWTAQERYLLQNSTRETIHRHSSIFWVIMQCGRAIGNIYIYINYFHHPIQKHDRETFYYGMISISVVACVIFMFIPKGCYREFEMGKLEDFVFTITLAAERNIIILIFTFIYCGLQLSFFNGVYTSAIMFTKFSNVCMHLDFIALSGLSVGVGTVIGGVVFGIFGAKTVRWGRYPVVIFGYILHLMAFVFIFINLPKNSSKECSEPIGVIKSNFILALFCSFLLGLGDTCFITQINGILFDIFRRRVPHAHYIFKFFQGLAASTSYMYSSFLSLHEVLSILVATSFIGTVCFCVVEFILKHQSSERNPEDIDDEIAVDHWFE